MTGVRPTYSKTAEVFGQPPALVFAAPANPGEHQEPFTGRSANVSIVSWHRQQPRRGEHHDQLHPTPMTSRSTDRPVTQSADGAGPAPHPTSPTTPS